MFSIIERSGDWAEQFWHSSLCITVLSFSCVQFLFSKHQANHLLIIFFVSNGFFLAIRLYKSIFNKIRLIVLDKTSDAKLHSDFNSFEDKKGFVFDFMTIFRCVLRLSFWGRPILGKFRTPSPFKCFLIIF